MIYVENDYRKALELLIARRRQFEPKLTYSRLAEAARVQPTYFSNVLKGRADFNADQLFAIAEELRADPEERDYLALLLERARCQHRERGKQLDLRIAAVRQRKLEFAANVQAKPIEPSAVEQAEYYLDPLLQLIHVYLTLPAYARDVRRIRTDLHLSEERFEQALRRLEQLGYAAINSDGSYRRLNQHRHLPQSSPICLPHQILMRLLSAEQLNRLPARKRKHVSVTFSCTPEVMEKIHEEFLRFLKKTEKLVGESKETDVFQLNFDLFPWSL